MVGSKKKYYKEPELLAGLKKYWELVLRNIALAMIDEPQNLNFRSGYLSTRQY